MPYDMMKDFVTPLNELHGSFSGRHHLVGGPVSEAMIWAAVYGASIVEQFESSQLDPWGDDMCYHERAKGIADKAIRDRRRWIAEGNEEIGDDKTAVE